MAKLKLQVKDILEFTRYKPYCRREFGRALADYRRDQKGNFEKITKEFTAEGRRFVVWTYGR